MGENKNQSILGTNFLYLFIALMLITLGARAQHREIYKGLLITEYLIVLMPTLLFVKLNGYPIKRFLRLNKISIKQFFYIILIVIFSYPVAVFLNFIMIIILSRFNLVIQDMVPIPSTSKELIIGFLIIALTPGICEETMFRGLIMNSYRHLGMRKAIIYTAILFGMFHFNIQNLLGPIFLGLIFGIISIKTNSLFSTILAHTVNNTMALLIAYNISKLNGFDQGPEAMAALSGDGIIYSLAVSAIIALIFGLLTNKMLKSLPNSSINSFELASLYDGACFEKLHCKAKMNSLERLPIWLFVILFVFWNYRIFLA